MPALQPTQFSKHALGFFGPSSPRPFALVDTSDKPINTIALGASIHDVLARIKSLPLIYPNIQLAYSQSHPLLAPVIITLPNNGLRLRFDGPEQRLRLIEVLDFSKSHLTFKDKDISLPSTEPMIHAKKTGPMFKQVYKIFGPTTPGEYIPPAKDADQTTGTYMLSYPGIAFSFPMKSSTWDPSTTWSSTVSILSSTATGAATALSLFYGESWEQARNSLFNSDMSQFLRSPIPYGTDHKIIPREVERAVVYDQGRVELIRGDAPSFMIVMGETTPQDLVTELGPPDSIHRKNDRRVSIHRQSHRKGSSAGHSRRNSSAAEMSLSPPIRGNSLRNSPFMDSEASSQAEDSEHSDEDGEVIVDGQEQEGSEQVFYNYYSHGFDILISNPVAPSAAVPDRNGLLGVTLEKERSAEPVVSRSHLTATKILFHGNVPGSWSFNRHRRLRWTLGSIPGSPMITSETPFKEIQQRLQDVFRSTYADKREEDAALLPMVVNRGWGRDEIGGEGDWGVLGSWEDTTSASNRRKGDGTASEESPAEKMGGAEVYGFPGLIFEKLKNGAVSCLMVH